MLSSMIARRDVRVAQAAVGANRADLPLIHQHVRPGSPTRNHQRPKLRRFLQRERQLHFRALADGHRLRRDLLEAGLLHPHGAAGGLGYMLLGFLGAKLERGVDRSEEHTSELQSH